MEQTVTQTTGYLNEYAEFLKLYHETEMDAEMIGAFIARLAQVYAEYNMKLAAANRERALVAQDINNRAIDGKAISSAKAETIVEATDEADRYNHIKAHVGNIEQMISAMRALQRGMLQEYNHMANS